MNPHPMQRQARQYSTMGWRVKIVLTWVAKTTIVVMIQMIKSFCSLIKSVCSRASGRGSWYSWLRQSLSSECLSSWSCLRLPLPSLLDSFPVLVISFISTSVTSLEDFFFACICFLWMFPMEVRHETQQTPSLLINRTRIVGSLELRDKR